jgi:hypothetical protein
VIKGKAREGIDYKLLPKGAWIPLLKRFGGLELIRFKDSDLYNRKFTIKFCPVSIVSFANAFRFPYWCYLLTIS